MSSPSADLFAKVSPLLAALKDRGNDQSLSTQEHDLSAKKTRKLLCDFMDSVLADVGTAFQPTEKNTSHLHTLLRILRHCLDSSPESFVGVESRLPAPSELPGLSNASVYSGNRIGEVSKAFTVWVISGLLNILAEPRCAEFHDSAMAALFSILQLVKGKDLILYNRLLTELITLMRDLVIVAEKLFSVSPIPAEFQKALPLYLNHFQFFQQGTEEQEKEQLSLSIRLVCIQNEGGCYSLQESVSAIISQVASDVPQFAHSNVLTVWKCVCQQLHTGLANIKKISLDIICSLLPAIGLPPVPILDILVRCLTALIELLGSGSCSALPGKKIIALEKSLSKCLGVLFQETGNKERRDSGRVQNAGFVLPPWHVGHLLTKLAGALSAGGLQAFLTLDLKIAVCHVILYIYIHVPIGYEDIRSVCYQTRDELNKALVNFIGQAAEQQYVGRCIYEAIKEEISRGKNGSGLKEGASTKKIREVTAMESTSLAGFLFSLKPKEMAKMRLLATWIDQRPSDEPSKKNKLPLLGRKSSSSSGSQLTEAVAPTAHLLANLAQKIDELLNSLGQKTVCSRGCLEELCREVEGVRVILEITSRSLFEYEPGSSHKISKRGKKGKAWFADTRLSQLFVIMRSSLQLIIQASEQENNKQQTNLTFKKLVQITGALYYVSGWITLPTDLCQFVVFLVSIPWLWKTSAPWMDLPSAFGWSTKAMLKASVVLKNILSSDIVNECLQQLAVFPGEVSPTWRIHVFSLVLAGPDELKRFGVHWLPTLMSSLGSFSYHLQEQLHKLLSNGCDTLVQKELGRSIGLLACVLTEQTEIRRYPSLPFDEPVGRHVKLYCPTCDAKSGTSEDAKAGHTRAAIFTPFLQLLAPEVPSAVKLSIIGSIQRMCVHMTDAADSAAHSATIKASCFDLIEDPDYDVRMAFSQVVHHLLKPGSQDMPRSSQETVMTKLKKAFVEASVNRNTKLQETVVLTIGQLGRMAKGDLLHVVVISLLDNLAAQSQLIRAIAFEQIQEVAKAQGKATQDLFVDYKQQICSFLVDAVHEAQATNPSDKEPQDIISEVATVFRYRDLQAFLKNTLRYIIPYLVKKATPTASAVLSLIARNLKMNRGEMLLENFKYIFSLLVRTCSAPELEKALGYIQKETDVELGSLLRSEAMSVYNQLLLYLSVSYNKVFSGLAMLASKDDSYTGCKDLKTRDDMANFLQSRLLGILAFYNTVLLGTNSDMEEKRLSLESLVKLMDIMGPKHITAVRMKVMGILRQALRFKDKGFTELSCTAWDCFVRNIQLNCLGPMLSQIMVTLLPYLNQLPSKVAHIFHYLIVENESKLYQHFHEIYFLPDIPELKRVNAVLLAVSGDSAGQADLKTQLRQSLKGVGHESVDVRKHALSKLKQLLHDNQAILHSYVLGNEVVDPVIPEIVSVLISGCRESDPEAKVLFGECLGELGAVDPGRYDKLAQEHVEEQVIYESGCEDTEFAVDLINELVRAFLAAHDTRAQDCSAYAIQEVLQVYGCSESKQDGSGYRLWKKFPEQIQEVLRPHLHSKYLSSANPNWSNLPKPVYRSAKGKVYNEWIGTWTSYMITKVKRDKAAHIFQSCSKIFKFEVSDMFGVHLQHDINTALFLLPHVLLHALLDGSEEAITEIHAEIMAVLTHAQRQDESVTAPASDFRHMSAQTIFSALDYLKRWSRTRSHAASVKAQLPTAKLGRSSSLMSGDTEHVTITKFLERIPQDVLATASYHCKAYTRALMHFEAFITSQKQDIQENLGFLQKLYIALDEPDGVMGVAASRKQEVPLHEQIREHESSGRLRDASACYERAIQEEPREVDHQKGLLNCLIGLGQVTTALMHVNGVLAQRPEWKSSLNAYRVEASWRLGQWDSLEGYLKMERGSSDWRVGLGRVLLAAKHKNEGDLQRQLQIVRSEQMGPLSAASMESGSCQRGYEYIVRLHMLREVEQSVKSLLVVATDDPDGGVHRSVVADWESRLHITQKSFRTREPILNLRRIVLNLFPSCVNLNKEQGKSWLQSAKVARKAGHVQTAYSSLLNAGTFSLPSLCIEKAKWHWGQGDFHQALLILQKGVSELSAGKAGTSRKASSTETDNLVQAKLLLLVGRWMEETAHYEVSNVIRKYKEVTAFHSEWENGHFYLAKYYDRLMTACYDGDEKQKGSPSKDFVPFVLRHYGLSLQFGNKFIYQSMPRLLTLWLDFGAKVNEHGRQTKASDKTGMREKLETLNTNMAELSVKLLPYQFLTAFSLLISRICHPNQKVFEVLEQILAKVLVTYRQQPMWMMMAVSKSSFAMRTRRCHEIFHKAKSQDPNLSKFIDDATKLADRLLEVCNKSSGFKGGVSKLSMSHDFSVLKRLVTDRNFSPIIVPLQSAMTVTLPFGAGNHPNHSPFPGLLPCIVGFEDTVEVLASLQKPKKITIRGSDGQQYTMMCKPKDDLRKDCRTMEFNQLINKCLRKDPESRRRQLHIRTYAVVPLNEECGLIEWVPNTQTLRNILSKIYREKNIHMKGGELKKIADRAKRLEDKVAVFKNELIPRHPPVFHEWFLKTFPDPTSWYTSRQSYCCTTAVISMVGYILGLGDRHGENILYDSTNGNSVHVDFNCLFGKGETFDIVERVPFRLTHNMINAMGPLGYEGVYRRSCEVTLRLMRNQCDSLLTTLRTFIYDPLVEWQKSRGRETASDIKAKEATGEVTNEEAVKILKDIEQRLKGYQSKNKIMIPLSIEGQVHKLINEATDAENLAQMYIGWAPYL